MVLGLLLLAMTDASNIKTSVSIISGKQYVREVLNSVSQRSRWIAPFDMAATVFMTLLKMLIVPLILNTCTHPLSQREFSRIFVQMNPDSRRAECRWEEVRPPGNGLGLSTGCLELQLDDASGLGITFSPVESLGPS
jgi:hypothetical protein